MTMFSALGGTAGHGGGAAAHQQRGVGHHQHHLGPLPQDTTDVVGGLTALEEGGLEKLIGDCCDATIRRAYELGR